MSSNEPIRFSHAFKLEAVRRMEAGENVSVLARELGVARKTRRQQRAPRPRSYDQSRARGS